MVNKKRKEMKKIKSATLLLGILAIMVLPTVVLAESVMEEGVLESSGVVVTPTQTGAHVTITVQEKEDMTLSILSGEERICTLHRGSLEAGEHRFVWDGKNKKGIQLPQGPYAVEVYSSKTGPYREGFFTLSR